MTIHLTFYQFLKGGFSSNSKSTLLEKQTLCLLNLAEYNYNTSFKIVSVTERVRFPIEPKLVQF